MRILKAGVLYCALVFGAGIVLGTIRTLWIVPRLGTRLAELMETPIMLSVTILAARRTVRRLTVPSEPPARLGMGFVALGLLLVAEFTLVLWLRGMSIREYLISRDPVAGTVYVMLAAFAVVHGGVLANLRSNEQARIKLWQMPQQRAQMLRRKFADWKNVLRLAASHALTKICLYVFENEYPTDDRLRKAL